MSEDGSRERPYTSAPVSREWADLWCKCAECGIEAISTKDFDFYVMEKLDDKLFRCEYCMWTLIKDAQ